MIMKRFAVIFLCFALLLCGCGSKANDIDVAAFADKVAESVDFGDELLAVPEKIISDYYTLPDGVESCKIYVSATSATASELAAFKCKDENAVKAVKSAVETRIEEQTASYENYRPDEKFRLENAVILTEGNYLVFAVSNDNDAVSKLFTEALK